ncbi:hypothetical protein Tco_1569592 [Tanacetum coccineum]
MRRLSQLRKFQAEYDLKATNIFLPQGLASDVYSLVNHHRVAKDLWERIQLLMQDLHTTNFDHLNAYLEQHELHANEVRIMREHSQDPLALSPQYGSIHPTQHYSTTYPSIPRAITYPSAPSHGQETVPQPRGKKRDATWFKDKVPLVEAQGSGKVLNEEELTFFADPRVEKRMFSLVPHSENTHNDMINQSVQEMSYYEQTHLVNYPENEITNDSNIIPYSQYLLETQNAAVQDTNSSAQQDAMILSVFEQLSNQVTNCNKVNKDNLIANESLSAELERYKEWVKLLEERQNVDLKKETKNIDKEIALEKKVKELDNIVYKIDFGKCFIPQQELSDEQAFWLQTSHPNTDQSALSPVNIKAPRELPKHTMEQAVILREIVEQAKSLNPLDSASYSALSRSTKSSRSRSTDNTKNDRILQISSSTQKKNKVKDHSRIVKSCFNKPNCVVEPSGNANVQHSKLNTNFELMCIKCISSMFNARHEMCFLEFVSDMNASSKSKSVKKANKKEEWKATGKVFTKIGYNWIPTGRTFTLVGNVCPLTRITATNKVPFREPIPLEVVAQESVITKVYTRRPKVPKTNGSSSKPKIAKSMISNKMEPDTSQGFNTSVAPSSSSLVNLSVIPSIIPVIHEVLIVPADLIVTPEVGAVLVVSPTRVLDLLDYSSSSDSDPSYDSLPPAQRFALVSPPFLCSDGSGGGRLAWRRISHHSSDLHSSPDSSSSSSPSDHSLSGHTPPPTPPNAVHLLPQPSRMRCQVWKIHNHQRIEEEEHMEMRFVDAEADEDMYGGIPDLEDTIYDIVHYMSELVASEERASLVERNGSLRLEYLKVRVMLSIERDQIDSLRWHMVLLQEEFHQVRRDRDDSGGELKWFGSLVI